MSNHSSCKRYFGTDGIRGIYGEELTDGLAMLVGNKLGMSAKGGLVVVGRDTRVSGNNLARAVCEGALAAGADVMDMGVVPTPCVAFVTACRNATFGVMISASHNPPAYNGIKIFGNDGKKLSESKEIEVEKHIAEAKLYYAQYRGNTVGSDDAFACYDKMFRSACKLDGLNIVLDCANGAAGAVAPELFRRAGACVYVVNDSSDGRLINAGCGALHPDAVAKEVLRTGADMGFSFDGDADRVIAVDENGKVVDGDMIIYILARRLKSQGRLPHDTVVGTIHTNMGVEAALGSLGISLVRTDVGDHNVIEKMCEEGLSVGGEQSGHIILREFSQTGDGMLAGAVLANAVRASGGKLSALNDCRPFPQVNAEIVTAEKEKIVCDKRLRDYVRTIEDMLGERGRIMLRPSGTEKKIRIMAESEDGFLAGFAARSIELFIRSNYSL